MVINPVKDLNGIDEIIKFYEKHPHLVGYREWKVLNDYRGFLRLERDQWGLYTLSGRLGSFQFTWFHPYYPNGTVVG